jgi:hypothetical protein
MYKLLNMILDGLEKNTYALVVASKEIDLGLNADKTKYIAMSRDQNAGRSHSIKTEYIYNINTTGWTRSKLTGNDLYSKGAGSS